MIRMTRAEILATIQLRIEVDEWLPGQKLPTSREFAEEYNTSTATIEWVMTILTERGLVYGVRGGRRYRAGAPPIDPTTGDILGGEDP